MQKCSAIGVKKGNEHEENIQDFNCQFSWFVIDYEQRKIYDLKMMYFVPLGKMEMILNHAGY